MTLRTRLTIIMLFLAFIPLALGVVIVAARGYTSDKELTANYVAEYDKLASSRLQSLFESRSSILKSFSQIPVVQMFMWDEAKGTMMNPVKQGTVEKIILARHDGTYYTTGGGNPFFGGLATSDNKSENATLSSIAVRDYFQYLVTQNFNGEDRSMIADPVISLSNSQIQVMVAHSVRGMDGKITGLIAGSISWDLLKGALDSLENELHQKFGNDARFMVLSHSGKYVYHWDKSKIIHIDEATKTAVSPSVQDGDDEALLAIADPILNGESGYADYTDAAMKMQYLCFYEPIEGTDFSVCMFLPKAVMNDTLQSQIKSAVIVLVIALILVALIARLFGGSIVKPLTSIANLLQEIAAGGGDLTKRLPVRGNDVISRISSNFNDFCDTLSRLLGEVRKEAGDLDKVSDRLADTVGQTQSAIANITDNAGALADNSSTLTNSVDTTSSAIHEIVRNIESMNNQVSSQARSVSDSAAAVEQMVGNIQSVSTNLTKSSETFSALKEDSDNGRTLMEAVIEAVRTTGQLSQELLETNEVLGTITSQTNMLAMNAAIEAAHAGEAGKGFSVVADEIRKLAEDSNEQSKKIAEVLVATVDNIQKVVDESVQANDAFETISNQIQAVDGLVQEVTAAMAEQAEGSKQVLESLRQMQDITAEIQSGSGEMAAGAGLIQDEMDKLDKVAVVVRDNAGQMQKVIASISETVGAVGKLSRENKDLGTSLAAKTNGFTL
ncbi:MAG: methyl-accepting chemotaxis protein [Treponema sp.]|nr:methyl-accepting chemotaxis protein [Candidatus Treponema caballi]